MAALVGQAAEDDAQFYSADIWKEDSGSDAASYEAEDEKPDVFDSDFGETESDEDEEDSEEERTASRNIKTKVR